MAATANGGLFSQAGTYLASNVAAAAVPLLLLPILTRQLPTAAYGQVAMFQVVVSAAGVLAGLSVQGAAARKYYDAEAAPRELAEFIGACMQLLVATSLVLLAAGWLLREPLRAATGLPPQWLALAVLAAGAGFVVQLRLGQWQVRSVAARYGIFQVAQAVAGAAGALVGVLALDLGAAGAILGQAVAIVLFAAAAIVSLHRDALLRFAYRPGFVREALAFGVPLLPHAGGFFLLAAVDRFVIQRELGLADVGVYVVAAQLALALKLAFDAFNKAYVPWLFSRLQRDDAAEKRTIVRGTYLYFALSLAAAAVATIAGPTAIALWAGPDYAAAGTVIGWLALAQAFHGMYLMVTNYIFYSKRTGLLSVVTVGTGLLNVALLVALVPRFGLQGAGIACAAAMAARFLLTWAVASRRHPMPWFTAPAPTDE